MSPITLRTDWGYVDQLDGIDLKDGEPLTVRWPDGSETPEVVVVRDFGYESIKEGHIPIRQSFVETVVRGTVARFPLRTLGLLAERREQ